MGALRRPGRHGVLGAIGCVLVMTGIASCSGPDAPAGGKSSLAIKAAEGGTLERQGLATVRIPPDGVSGDAVLRVTEPEDAGPDPDAVFVPVGAAVSVAVEGASLTAPATLELPAQPPADGGDQPFAPLAMYLDEAGEGWVPVESRYDPDEARVVAETTKLSTWRAFAWDWQAVDETAASLVAGAFGDGAAAQVTPPECPRQQEAEAVARVEAPSGDRLPTCLDLDGSGGLVLRVVNGRGIAVQVQQLDGVELAERRQQPPSSVYGGPVIAKRLAQSTSFRLAVLGPGEEASFRVTNLSQATGISTTPSTLSYVTDVLDIGISELSWMLGSLGSPAAGDKAGLYGALFASGDVSACVTAGIDEEPGGATASATSAIADLISDVVFRCLGEEAAARLPADLPAPGYAGSLVEPGLRVVADHLADGNYLDGLVSGAESVSVQVIAP